MRAFHALVDGEVQGVGFRYSALRLARDLGLVGWVRNLEDGRVEVWAEGDDQELHELLAWLEEGPSGAWVREVESRPCEPTGRYSVFSVAF